MSRPRQPVAFSTPASEPDIYELYYQQEEKWFSSRTGKINHSSPGWTSVVPRAPSLLWGTKSNEVIIDIVIDDTRNLLYSLSNTSTIRTYHMEGADRLTRVIEKTKMDCLRDMTHMLNGTSNLLNDRMNIVAISPITATTDCWSTARPASPRRPPTTRTTTAWPPSSRPSATG